jgi:NADPH2:quinone reductase
VRAVVARRHGGPEVLALEEREAPLPTNGQALVDVAFAGVNYRDIYEREGVYDSTPPLICGMEGAGRVVALGPDTSGLAIGDRVAWASTLESYAEQVALDSDRAVPIPDAVTDELAAAVLLQGLTAHCLCCDVFPVSAGEVVVVHAAAGGVGLLLTQMVKLRGGRVIATTSSAEKGERARAAGADEVIGYEHFDDAVRELTDGEGAHVVFDGIGAATFDASLACLRPCGMLAVYGWASGVVPPVDMRRLQARSLFLTRPSMNHYTATREHLLARANDVFTWLGDGRLEVHVGGVYPLDDAAQAQRDLQSRATTGKLLLAVGS